MKWVIIGIAAALVVGLAYVIFLGGGTASTAAATCPQADQSRAVSRFVVDVWLLAGIAGAWAGFVYWAFLRVQAFFGHNLGRLGVSIGVGIVVSLLLIWTDYRSSSDCLRTAIGPNTQIDPTEAFIIGRIANWVSLAVVVEVVPILAVMVLLTLLLRWRWLERRV